MAPNPNRIKRESKISVFFMVFILENQKVNKFDSQLQKKDKI